MKRAFVLLALGVSVAACDAGSAREAARPADAAPVGSSGSASAAPGAATPAADASVTPPTKAAAASPAYRDITVPAGTLLPLELKTAVASDASNVEDPVRATLRRAITIDGTPVLPAGALVTGHVTAADRSARVKGRARVAFRFNRIDLPGEGDQLAIRTATVTRIAEATKKQDAAKIGAGAAGGAIVGGILGGGDGAAKGAAVGGGAGTAVVLATRGKEVRLGAGTPVSVTLSAPLTIRVPVREP
jgi:hypothetical protein